MSIGLEQEIVDRQVRDRAARQLTASGHRLPRLQDLADPHGARARMPADLASVDPDSADTRNLFRVHGIASDRRALADVPAHRLAERVDRHRAKMSSRWAIGSR